MSESRIVPPREAVPHEVVLDSGRCSACSVEKHEIAPGETRHVNHMSQVHFRVEEAGAVEGIDYDAFEVGPALVGHVFQFIDRRPAREMLKRLRRFDDLELDDPVRMHARADEAVPFNTCQAALSISIGVTNVSDRPQRFAVKLVGRALL